MTFPQSNVSPLFVQRSLPDVARPDRDAQTARPPLPAHLDVASQRYDTVEVDLDPEARTFWGFMRPHGRGSFTPELLRDILRMQSEIGRLFADHAGEPQTPFDYIVFGSRNPGIFNLGGDLGLFADKIRRKDRASLRDYAYSCVDAVHNNYVACNVPATTIGLVQGDALGGGFECALSLDVIIAEKKARMGLPEILFNLFPGMGAYSFLSRRLDPARAEKMILSGKIYTADELHEMGVVDLVAPDGEGEHAVREYIDRHAYRRNAYQALLKTRRRVNPVTLSELRDVTDIWVEAALNLNESDLRRMARIVTAQDRRRGQQQAALMSAE